MADIIDDDDYFVADPEPYLVEPEFTEEELAIMDREREERYETVQTGANERTRANSNWWCKLAVANRCRLKLRACAVENGTGCCHRW